MTVGAITCAGQAGLARKKVHALHVKVFGQLGLRRRAFIAIEALDDGATDETDLSGQLVQLRLRQSAADSGGPQIYIAARRQ